MGTLSDFHTYLREVYPSLNLRAGLVFDWPGVRFGLWPRWDAESNEPKMMYRPFRSRVVDRALTLFHAVNEPQDSLFLILDTWREPDRPARPKTGLWVLGHYLKYRHLLVKVGCEEFPYLYADCPEDEATVRTVRFCVPCRVSDIRVPPLLAASANADFATLKPRVVDDCYFVNTSKNVILHMVDDCRLDVISSAPAYAQALALRFKDWVYGGP